MQISVDQLIQHSSYSKRYSSLALNPKGSLKNLKRASRGTCAPRAGTAEDMESR